MRPAAGLDGTPCRDQDRKPSGASHPRPWCGRSWPPIASAARFTISSGRHVLDVDGAGQGVVAAAGTPQASTSAACVAPARRSGSVSSQAQAT